MLLSATPHRVKITWLTSCESITPTSDSHDAGIRQQLAHERQQILVWKGRRIQRLDRCRIRRPALAYLESGYLSLVLESECAIDFDTQRPLM